MKSVRVRDIVIGEGRVKICVPLIGRNKEELTREAGVIAGLMPDVIELRADFIDGISEYKDLEGLLAELRREIGEIPLLFTLRSADEGGQTAIDDEDYIDINSRAISSGLIDMADVELFKGDDIVRGLIRTAREAGVKVVVSNHDFESTPDSKVIKDRLRLMEDIGADIAKIAVMPESEDDVRTLIDAASEVCASSECPIIAVSMGELGRISRTDCGLYGFAVTFASAISSSAPGQIGIEELRQVLK